MAFLSSADCFMAEPAFAPETLTAALADGTVSGVNLREDPDGRQLWGEIRDLRDEARRIERRADDGDQESSWDAAVPLWRQIAQRSREILIETSRDLNVAAVAIEALARVDGFPGLAEGFTAARVMVEQIWSDLFPVPDPDDGPADEDMIAEERAFPILRLVGLEGEGLLAGAIMRIPIVEGRDGEGFGLAHWRSSRELVGVEDSERIATAVSRGGTAPEAFAAAVEGTPSVKVQEIFTAVRAARAAWDSLAAAVATASGDRVIVPTIPLRELFEECEAAMRTFAPGATDEVLSRERQDSALTAVSATNESAAEGNPPGVTSMPAAAGLASRPVTREHMLVQLEQIAEFFEQHDPHSLIGAQIRNIVRMARLSRTEYYRELIGDEAALESLKRIAGLRFEESDSKSDD